MDDYRIEITRVDQLVASLVYAQARGRIGRPAMLLLRLLGVDARPQSIGPGLHLPHSTTGLVIHPSVRIGFGHFLSSWLQPLCSQPARCGPGSAETHS